MIVCLSGKARSGKDTTADVMIKNHNFVRITLADPIRELCAEAFNIPFSTFISDELKQKPFEEPIYLNKHHLMSIIRIVENNWGFYITDEAREAIANTNGEELKHPRHILQFVGTEVLRNNIDEDIFLKLADKRMEDLSKNYVVTDCRFSNERKWFKDKGAVMCLINRPQLSSTDTHSSENDLGTEDDYDVIMTNNGSLSGFKIDIGEWIRVKLNRRSY